MKHLYRLVVSLLLFVGFQSCVDEDGAGVPSPKSLIIEADEYTLDMTDLTTPQFIAFRWVILILKVKPFKQNMLLPDRETFRLQI